MALMPHLSFGADNGNSDGITLEATLTDMLAFKAVTTQ